MLYILKIRLTYFCYLILLIITEICVLSIFTSENEFQSIWNIQNRDTFIPKHKILRLKLQLCLSIIIKTKKRKKNSTSLDLENKEVKLDLCML